MYLYKQYAETHRHACLETDMYKYDVLYEYPYCKISTVEMV